MKILKLYNLALININIKKLHKFGHLDIGCQVGSHVWDGRDVDMLDHFPPYL